jgi:anti-sigma B factor antagonist
MKIDEREESGVTILDLHGKLLIGDGVDELRQEIGKLVNKGRTQVSLNLAGVPYIDSAGLGEIVRWYTTLSRREGKLRLLNINNRVRELLTVTGLLRFFDERAE